jgi:parallel beta helix pectate lyase-like protein
VVFLYILCLIVSTSLSAFVQPIDGENLWRLVSQVADTVDSIESDLEVIGSLFDTMISDTERLDQDLLSVSDILSSQLEIIVSDIESLQETISSELEIIDQNLLSISDVLVSLIDITISDIESAQEFLGSEIDTLIFISTELQSELEQIDADVLSAEDAILSAIEQLEDCIVGMPITTVPFTINLPGVYTVCNDLTLTTGTLPLISIAASDVTLDLGGYTLITGPSNYGVAVNTLLVQNVQVYNGYIVVANGSDQEGIIARGATNLLINDISIINAPNASMSIGSDCHGVTIRRCSYNGTNGNVVPAATNPGALYIDGLYGNPFGVTDSIIVEDCSAVNNVVRGFSCNNCQNVSAANYTVYNAQLAGFRIDSGSVSVDLANCLANNCCVGFNMISSSSILNNCVALQNTDDVGFQTDISSTGAVFVECEACTNDTGFVINGANALLKRCVVANNITGIIVSATASNTQILDTCPVNNTTNFVDASSSTTFINLGTVLEILLSAIETIEPCCSILETFDSFVDSAIETIVSILDGLSSPVDALSECLVGTTITQAMIPYNIVLPGLYTLCEDITSSGAPSITITASDVTLDLHYHTITNTTDRGIACTSVQNNITIMQGTIVPALEAIAITGGCQDVCLRDIQTINAAAIALNITNATGVVIDQCVCDGFNGTPLSGGAAISVITSGDVSVYNCTVQNGASEGFFVLDPTGPIEINNCSSFNTVSTAFSIIKSVAAVAHDVLLEYCVADTAAGQGFLIIGIGAFPNYSSGPTLNSCIAQNITGQGFLLSQVQQTVLRNCITANNTAFGLFATNISNLLVEGLLMNSNTGGGCILITGQQCTLRQCSAINNTNNGFTVVTSIGVVIDDSLASGNSIVGINIDVPSIVTILDTRSSNVNPTSLNPAYTLNAGFDILNSATVILTS